MDELRVAIADDEEGIRIDLAQALTENCTDIKFDFKQFTNPVELTDYMRRYRDYADESKRLDLLLLDVKFPGFDDGLLALPKIRKYAPTLPIIILTGNEDPPETFKPYYKYNFKYIAKAESIEKTQNIVQINIAAALNERNKYKTLKDEISCALNNFKFLPENINSITTGFLFFNQYTSEIDPSSILICWGKAYEDLIKSKAQKYGASSHDDLSSSLKFLCESPRTHIDFPTKNKLYKLKELRNRAAHRINPVTFIDAQFFKDTFFGKVGYTSGLVAKITQF